VRGDLLFEVHSDTPGRLKVGARLELVTRSGARRVVEIQQNRKHSLGAILRLDGVTTREQAEALRGAVLEVARSEAPEAPEGAYYFYEIVGCRCVDESVGPLGTVTEVVEDGGGLLLEIVDADRKLLIPFVEHFLVNVDVERGLIDVKLPEGLVETCASTL